MDHKQATPAAAPATGAAVSPTDIFAAAMVDDTNERDAILKGGTPGDSPATPAATPAADADAGKKDEEGVPGEAKPAEAAPKKPSIDDLFQDEEPAQEELSEEVKAALKKRFGTDDLNALVDAPKAEVAKTAEELRMARERIKTLDAMEERIKKLPYELGRAMTAALNGEDYKPYLDKMAKGITVAKEAKDLDPFDVVEDHYPGRFSEEQKQAIKDGDPVLKAGFEALLEVASEKHNAIRAQELAKMKASREAEESMSQAEIAANAEAIAHFKGSKLSQLVPADMITKFETGQLERELLYNPDGTKRKEFLVLLAKGMLHEQLVASAKEVAKKAGGDDREASIRARLPDGPVPETQKRAAAPAKDQVAQESQMMASLFAS